MLPHDVTKGGAHFPESLCHHFAVSIYKLSKFPSLFMFVEISQESNCRRVLIHQQIFSLCETLGSS